MKPGLLLSHPLRPRWPYVPAYTVRPIRGFNRRNRDDRRRAVDSPLPEKKP
jgi:hypothetical protein